MESDRGSVGFTQWLAGSASRLPEWALCRRDGSVAAVFGPDATREDVRRALADRGLVLRDDDEVMPVAPPAERPG